MQHPLIECEQVPRSIDSRNSRIMILDKVTFAVPNQSLFAVNGPSGSGKSTLLNIITGIDRPSSGRVVLAGEELHARSENKLARWRVASVFLMEGLAFAVLACLIGTALGILLAYGLVALLSKQVVPLDFLFDPLAILVTLLFVLLVVALACMGPSLTASRLRICERLRYE